MIGNTIANYDAGVSWNGTRHRFTFTAYATGTNIAMGTYNGAPYVANGEALAGNDDNSNIRLYNRIQAAISRSSTNLGSFSWTNGGIDPISDMSFQLSAPLAVSVTKDETLAIRYGIHKFDTTINSQRPIARTTLKHGGGARNVTADVNGYVTGTSTDTGTDDVMGDPVYVRVNSTTLRAVEIEGSSIGFGGNGWSGANIQNSRPASSAVQGATSPAELVCYQDGTLTANTGMVWHNKAESGSSLFDQYNQSSTANDLYRPNRFRARTAEKIAIGYTDCIYSCFVNESAQVAPGYSLANALAAWDSVIRQLIRRNISLSRRTWIFLEGNPTTWTGGGTPWDTSVAAETYQNAQTPTNNALFGTTYRAALLVRLDSICKELGSAWVFDTGKVTHVANIRGEHVWAKPANALKPTDDGTHPNHDISYVIRDAVTPFFGGRDATTFPVFGLLNP